MNKKLIQNSSTSSIKRTIILRVTILGMDENGLFLQFEENETVYNRDVLWKNLPKEKELLQFLKDKIAVNQNLTEFPRVYAIDKTGFWWHMGLRSSGLIPFEYPIKRDILMLIRKVLK